MKTTQLTGASIKQDNGSGYRLSSAFPRRRFHAATIYTVRHNGIVVDASNIVSITRSKSGWTE
jgi:hypothetical protein